jgi:hypothetical protein
MVMYVASGLPPGLSCDPWTGEIGGEPDPGSHGIYDVTVTRLTVPALPWWWLWPRRRS